MPTASAATAPTTLATPTTLTALATSGAPDVAVITATDLRADRVDWLVDAHASLHQNESTWEHWVVVDGTSADRVPAQVAACPQVRVPVAGTYGFTGVAAARNLALFKTTSPWIATVDDDDIYTGGALDARLRAATDHDVDWVGGLLADLADGSLKTWDQPSPRGLVPAGGLLAAWPHDDDMFPYCSSSSARSAAGPPSVRTRTSC